MSDSLPEYRRENVRAADADRDLVAQLLTNALADGQLTVSEYDERTTAAYRAKTYGELDVLTSDLALNDPAAPLYAAKTPNTDRAIAHEWIRTQR